MNLEEYVILSVFIKDFCQYGFSSEKMNISKVIALRAPHTVGGRPQRATATRGGAGSRAGTCEGTGHAPNFRIPGLVQDSRFRGEK